MTSNLKGFPILKPKDCPSALLPDGNLCRLCRCPSTSKIKKHKTWKYLILFLLPSQGWDSFWFYFLMLRIYQHFKILPLSFVYNQSVDPVFYKVSHTQHFVPNSGPLKFQILSLMIVATVFCPLVSSFSISCSIEFSQIIPLIKCLRLTASI